MSMQVGTPEGEEMVEMNTTPLIDVMLVLLVMLIITLPVMTHAVKLDMPNANNPPPPQERPEVISLEIDYDGTIVWDGNIVKDLPTLDAYFRQESMKDPQPEVHLQPDPHAKYDVVAKVLASAQRNHMVKIGFVNTPQFNQ